MLVRSDLRAHDAVVGLTLRNAKVFAFDPEQFKPLIFPAFGGFRGDLDGAAIGSDHDSFAGCQSVLDCVVQGFGAGHGVFPSVNPLSHIKTNPSTVFLP